MNWKNEAKERLRKYDKMRVALANIPQEITRLEREYTAIRSARTDGSPVRGGTSTREDALINNIVERQELAHAYANARDWVEITDRGLQTLKPEARKILTQMFIYPETGGKQRLCEELCLEQSSMYRRCIKALRDFTVALYGICTDDL